MAYALFFIFFHFFDLPFKFVRGEKNYSFDYPKQKMVHW